MNVENFPGLIIHHAHLPSESSSSSDAVKEKFYDHEVKQTFDFDLTLLENCSVSELNYFLTLFMGDGITAPPKSSSFSSTLPIFMKLLEAFKLKYRSSPGRQAQIEQVIELFADLEAQVVSKKVDFRPAIIDDQRKFALQNVDHKKILEEVKRDYSKIKQLADGESFLYPMSWFTAEGMSYARVVQYVKTSSNTVDILIFNPGFSDTHLSLDHQDKTLIHPLISLSEIRLDDPHFNNHLVALEEMHHSHVALKSFYEMEKLFKGIFSPFFSRYDFKQHLVPFLNNKPNTLFLSDNDRSGSVVSVLKAMVRQIFNDIAFYKDFIHESKYHFLLAADNASRRLEKIPFDLASTFVVVSENLFRNFSKILNSLQSSSQASENQDWNEKIRTLREIKNHYEMVKKKYLSKDPSANLTLERLQEDREHVLKLAQAPVKFTHSAAEAPINPLFELSPKQKLQFNFLKSNHDDFSMISDALTYLNSKVNQYEKTDETKKLRFQFFNEFTAFLDFLPMPTSVKDSIWDNFNEAQLLSIQQQLSQIYVLLNHDINPTILEFYNKTAHSLDAAKILTLIHFTAMKIEFKREDSILKQMKNNDQVKVIPFFNAEVLLQINGMYLNTHKELNFLHQFIEYSTSCQEEAPPEAIFFNQGLFEEVEEENQTFLRFSYPKGVNTIADLVEHKPSLSFVTTLMKMDSEYKTWLDEILTSGKEVLNSVEKPILGKRPKQASDFFAKSKKGLANAWFNQASRWTAWAEQPLLDALEALSQQEKEAQNEELKAIASLRTVINRAIEGVPKVPKIKALNFDFLKHRKESHLYTLITTLFSFLGDINMGQLNLEFKELINRDEGGKIISKEKKFVLGSTITKCWMGDYNEDMNPISYGNCEIQDYFRDPNFSRTRKVVEILKARFNSGPTEDEKDDYAFVLKTRNNHNYWSSVELQSLHQSIRNPLVKELLRIGSFDQISLASLIHFFNSNLHEFRYLLDEDAQALLWHFFFSSSYDSARIDSPEFEKRLNLGLTDAVFKDEKLCKSVTNFIATGIKTFDVSDFTTYYERNEKDKFLILGFFYQMSYYLALSAREMNDEKKIHLFDLSPAIAEKMKLEALLDDQEASFYQFFKTLYQTLDGFKDSSAFAEIWGNHYTFTELYRPFEQRSWHIQRGWCQQRVFKHLVQSIFKGSQSLLEIHNPEDNFWHELGTKIWDHLRFPPVEEKWSLQNGYLTADAYAIDLSAGLIFKNGHNVSPKSLQDFKKILDSLKGSISSMPVFIAIKRGSFDAVVAVNGDLEFSNAFHHYQIAQFESDQPVLMQKIAGAWCELQTNDLDALPNFLRLDHCVWAVNPPQPDPLSPKLWISSLEGDELRFEVLVSNEIVAVDAEGSPLDEEPTTISRLKECEALNRFSHEIMVTSTQDGISSLLFPEFLSETGASLRFVAKQREMVLENDEQWLLMQESPATLNFLGLDHVLFLQHKETKKARALVAVDQITKKSEKENSLTFHNFIDSTKSALWKTKHFLTFNYSNVDGSLKAVTNSGRLYLSYLYLFVGEYEKSMRQLAMLDPSKVFSPLDRKILTHLEHDFSENLPNALGIKLKAALLYLKECERKSPKKCMAKFFLMYSFDRLLETLLNYKNLSSNVSYECRIDNEGIRTLKDQLNQKCESLDLAIINPERSAKLHLLNDRPFENKNRLNFYTALSDSYANLSIENFTSYLQNNNHVSFTKSSLTYFNSDLDKQEVMDLVYKAIQDKNKIEQEKLFYRFYLWNQFIQGTKPSECESFFVHLMIYFLLKKNIKYLHELRIDPKGFLTRSTLPGAAEKFMDNFKFLKHDFPQTFGRKDYFTLANEISKRSHKSMPVDYSYTYSPSKKDETPLRIIQKDVIRKQINFDWKTSHPQACEEWLGKLKSGETFVDSIEMSSAKTNEDLDEALEDFLDHVNKLPSDQTERELEISKIEGKIKDKISFLDCVRSFITHDILGAFQALNPHLTQEDVVDLSHKFLHVLELKTNLSHMKRMTLLLKDDDVWDSTSMVHQKLVKELEAFRILQKLPTFESDAQMMIRMTMGLRKKIPYFNQLEIVQNMLDARGLEPIQNSVHQLMMGDGKSDVVAPLVAMIIANRPIEKRDEKGIVSLCNRPVFFFVPPSQLHSVAKNLQMNLKPLGLDLLVLDLERKDFSLRKLKKMFLHCSRAAEKGYPILANPYTVQGFQLELISEWNKENNLNGAHARAQSSEKIKTLIEILKLSETAYGLMDEVHVIMDCFQQLNYVEGEPVSINDDYLPLVQKIMKVFVDKDTQLEINDKRLSISEFAQVQENNMSFLDENTFMTYLAPVIARKLRDTEPAFELGIYTDTLVEYLSKKCSHKEEAAEFEAFLGFLKTLREGSSEGKKQVDLIVKAKYLLTALIPSILSQKPGDDYGEYDYDTGSKKDIGAIVPMLGPGVYSGSKFANPTEQSLYYYIFNIIKAPTVAKFRLLLEDIKSAAKEYALEEMVPVRSTVEYEIFTELFGYGLDEALEDDTITQAIISKLTMENRFDMINWLIKLRVSSHKERLSNSGSDLARMVGFIQGMSGTPRNVEGYPDFFSEQKYLKSINSTVIDKLIEKNVEDDSVVILPQGYRHMKMNDFLSHVVKKSNLNERCIGLADSGGLLEPFGSAKTIAKETFEWIIQMQKENLMSDKINAVLFFDKDVLCAYKGNGITVEVGGTSLKNLKRFGLHKENYFVVIPKDKCTGTDIPLRSKGVLLVTEHPLKTTETQLVQTIMRAREFLSGEQNVKIVAPYETLRLLNKEKEGCVLVNDVLKQCLEVEKDVQQKEIVRFFEMEIPAFFRHALIQELKATYGTPAFQELYALSRKFLFTIEEDNPFEQYGAIKKLEETKKYFQTMLIGYYKTYQNTFKNFKNFCQTLESSYPRLTNWIEKACSLPELYASNLDHQSSSGEKVHEEKEVQMEEKEVKQVRVQNQVLEKETQLELEVLKIENEQGFGGKTDVREKKLSFEMFEGWLEKIGIQADEERHSKTRIEKINHFLKTHCELTITRPSIYNHLFENQKKLFKDNKLDHIPFSTDLYISKSFEAITDSAILPFNHTKNKPLSQILVLNRNKKFVLVAVTAYEANQIHTYLSDMYESKNNLALGAWLINADGKLLVETPDWNPFLEDDEELCIKLAEMNLVGGRVSYLEKNFDFIASTLFRDRFDLRFSSPEDKKNAYLDYLEQKIKFSPYEKARYEKLDFDKRRENSISSKKIEKDSIFKEIKLKRKNHEKAKVSLFIPRTPLELKVCRDKRLKVLHSDWVSSLGIENDDKDALAELGKLKINLEEHYQKQLSYLSKENVNLIKPQLVPYLPIKIVHHLKNPDLIKELTLNQVKQGRLFKHAIQHVNPEYYDTFDDVNLIQGIPLQHLSKVSKENWVKCSDTQLKELLKDSRLWEDKNIKEYVTKNKDLIPFIPSQYLKDIMRKLLKHVTEKQIGGIDSYENDGVLDYVFNSPYLEDGISIKFWCQSIQGSLVPHVPLQHVKFLVSTQVPFCLEDQVNALAPEHVPFLKDEQIKHLKDEELVNAVPDPKLTLLGSKGVFKLSFEKKLFLIKNHHARSVYQFDFKKLERSWIKELENEENPVKDHLIPLIPSKYLNHVPRDKLFLVTEEQINRIESYERGGVLDYILTSNDLHPKISTKLWCQSMGNALVLHIPESLVKLISNSQVPYCTNEQINALVPSHVPFLEDKQIIHLEKKELVNAVADSKLKWLGSEGVVNLSFEKKLSLIKNERGDFFAFNLRVLEDSFVKDLKTDGQPNQELISRLEPFCFNLIPKEEAFYQHIHIDYVDMIDPREWHLLSLGQQKELIKKISESHFEGRRNPLSVEEINFFDRACRNQDLIPWIPGNYLLHVKENFEAITKNQIMSIRRAEIISELVSFAKNNRLEENFFLQHIDASMIREVPLRDIIHLTDEQLMHHLGFEHVSQLILSKINENEEEGVVLLNQFCERLGESFVEQLVPEFIPHLDPKYVNFVNDSHVYQLNKRQIQALTHIKKIARCSKNQIRLIRRNHWHSGLTGEDFNSLEASEDGNYIWSLLTANSIKELHATKVPRVRPVDLCHLRNPLAIAAVPNHLVYQLTREQIREAKTRSFFLYSVATLTVEVAKAIFGAINLVFLPLACVPALVLIHPRQAVYRGIGLFVEDCTRPFKKIFHLFWNVIPALMTRKLIKSGLT